MRTQFALTKMRMDFMRIQTSNFAQDQFCKGFRAGYRTGRQNERAGAQDITETYRHDPHPQIEIDGIEVDEGMRDLLIALWELGLNTQYSCQGHPDKFGPHQSYNRDCASQIVFGDVEHAFKFLKKSAELFGYAHHGENGFVLHTTTPLENGTPRDEVTFSLRLLPELTQLWVDFETTVPRAAVSTEMPEP